MNMIIGYLLMIPGAVLTITIHEYVKALASTALGDTLPKRNGRCTLNPARHIDPLGFIIMILFGFGWGNPVETSPMFYKDRKKGTLIVYILPSVANVIFAVATLGIAIILTNIYYGNAGIFAYGAIGSDITSQIILYTSVIFRYCARLSLAFALFNIVPVYPLDGARVLNVFLSPQSTIKMTQYEKILQMILVFLIVLGIFSRILNPIINAFVNISI